MKSLRIQSAWRKENYMTGIYMLKRNYGRIRYWQVWSNAHSIWNLIAVRSKIQVQFFIQYFHDLSSIYIIIFNIFSEIDHQLNSLHTEVHAFPQTKLYWKCTFKVRRELLKKNRLTVFDYFNYFPCLKNEDYCPLLVKYFIILAFLNFF